MDKLASKCPVYKGFECITKLAGIYKVLPPHTADCERDFSFVSTGNCKDDLEYEIERIIKQCTVNGKVKWFEKGARAKFFFFLKCSKYT